MLCIPNFPFGSPKIPKITRGDSKKTSQLEVKQIDLKVIENDRNCTVLILYGNKHV